MLDLLADAAPTHVAHFITQARAGAYDGTVFHRVIAMGIIQGGDPLSKDPAQAAKYGTGGLGRLRFEANAEKHTRGAVSAVLVPGNRDSAGNQFFIVVTDQPALDGQYTVFARVVDGINVAQKISTMPATNAVPAEPHRNSKGVDSRQAGAGARAVRVSGGRRTELVPSGRRDVGGGYHARVLPGPRPESRPPVPAAGVVRRVRRHVVSPRGPRIRGADRAPADEAGAAERAAAGVRPHAAARVQSDAARSRDRLDGARLDDPASASSSFFIVLGRSPALDNQYTVFGRVVAGLDVLEKIENAPLNGEAPVTRIEVTGVRLIRQ